jgi:hypothetical protein
VVNEIETVLLPLKWLMDQAWVLKMIKQIDPDAA